MSNIVYNSIELQVRLIRISLHTDFLPLNAMCARAVMCKNVRFKLHSLKHERSTISIVHMYSKNNSKIIDKLSKSLTKAFSSFKSIYLQKKYRLSCPRKGLFNL